MDCVLKTAWNFGNRTSLPCKPNLLLSTVDEISEFSLGHTQAQPVTIMGVNSPALEWILRDREVSVVSELNPQVAPPIVITPMMNDLGLPSAYRGQDFTWRGNPAMAGHHDARLDPLAGVPPAAER